MNDPPYKQKFTPVKVFSKPYPVQASHQNNPAKLQYFLSTNFT